LENPIIQNKKKILAIKKKIVRVGKGETWLPPPGYQVIIPKAWDPLFPYASGRNPFSEI